MGYANLNSIESNEAKEQNSLNSFSERSQLLKQEGLPDPYKVLRAALLIQQPLLGSKYRTP